MDANLADIMVSSCYKWLLGVHGAAVFYVNRERAGDFYPPFLGWNSPSEHGGWEAPTQFELKKSAHCFQPGNANFLGIYILDNALDHLLNIGIESISDHALSLSGQFFEHLKTLKVELMTPEVEVDRAGNVCFIVEDMVQVLAALEARNVLIWGAYAGFGRLRISTHLYNDSRDVEICLDALNASIPSRRGI